MTFHFDEDTHRYRLEDGRIIPGHTRVLDLGGLVPYKAIEPDILERKAAIGREAHLACLMNDQGKRFTFDPRVQGHLEAWQDFRRMSGFTPTLCEYRDVYLLHGLAFGMQIDRLGHFPNEDHETVIELKTVTQVMPHHGVQLAVQAACVTATKSPISRLNSPLARFHMRKRIVLQLFESGKWKIHHFIDSHDLEAFHHALATTYWKMKHDKIYREVIDGNGATANF